MDCVTFPDAPLIAGESRLHTDMKPYFLSIFLTIFLFSAHSKESLLETLSTEEKCVLSSFFKTLLVDSEGGFVLLGEKPMCVEGVFSEENIIVSLGNKLHKKSIYLKKGYQIWEKFNTNEKNQNIFLRMSDVYSDQWKEIALINKKHFLRVVEENLPLFQYVLGPNTTPENLFDEYMQTKVSIGKLLKEDRVLIGMILGFGTQNALMGSRLENLEEQQASEQSLGFSSLEEEHLKLKKEAKLSTTFSQAKIPLFLAFDNNETESLVTNYAKTSQKIEKLLTSENFLTEVLTYFFEEERTYE
ncbi:MAG: hypothetical protein AB7S94_09040 [Simkaniaceae bacterium]